MALPRDPSLGNELEEPKIAPIRPAFFNCKDVFNGVKRVLFLTCVFYCLFFYCLRFVLVCNIT